MRLSTLLVLSAASFGYSQTTGQLGDAPVVFDHPRGGYWTPVWSHISFKSTANNVTGSVSVKPAYGPGLSYYMSIRGLPEGGGPYRYHIHTLPVPADGNCGGTAGHLDPYLRLQTPPCNTTAKATCEVGDLAGKYGAGNETYIHKAFVDLYSSLNPRNVAFVGNRSMVIHYGNGTRLACANFTLPGYSIDW